MRTVTAAQAHEIALLAAYRGGDLAAMDELVRMHRTRTLGWARRYARNPSDAEDLVNEAFLRVLRAISRGSGPTVSMGLYLASAVRNAAADRDFEQRRHIPVDDITALIDEAVEDIPPGEGEVFTAFDSLPLRWRQVLWLRDVECISAKESAGVLGLTPSATAQLHWRARRGLRTAYLDLLGDTPAAVCKAVRPQLRGYVRGTLCRKDKTRVDEHVSDCLPCAEAVAALRTVRPSRALFLPFPLLLPLLHHRRAAVGVTAAAGAAALGALLLGVFGGATDDGQTGARVPTQPETVLSAGGLAGQCQVVFVPEAADGPRHFQVDGSTSSDCWVSFSWEGEVLLDPTPVIDRTVLSAPRSGTYEVRLGSVAGTKTTQYEVP